MSGKAGPVHPALSVVFPAYQAADRITESVLTVRSELTPLVDGLEVLVVDDGSTDATAELATTAGADKVITTARNYGKGAAVQRGMLEATGAVVAFLDADLAYHPLHLLDLKRAIDAGADVAIGTRRHADSSVTRARTPLRQMAGAVFCRAVATFTGVHYSDSQCGIKAFRRDVVGPLFGPSVVRGFAFDVEILALAQQLGLNVVEVPVTVDYDDRSTVRISRDAPKMARDLVMIRLRLVTGSYGHARLNRSDARAGSGVSGDSLQHP